MTDAEILDRIKKIRAREDRIRFWSGSYYDNDNYTHDRAELVRDSAELVLELEARVLAGA